MDAAAGAPDNNDNNHYTYNNYCRPSQATPRHALAYFLALATSRPTEATSAAERRSTEACVHQKGVSEAPQPPAPPLPPVRALKRLWEPLLECASSV